MISRSIVCPECQQPTQVDFEIPTDITSEQYRQLGRNCQKCGARLSVKQMREAVQATEKSLDPLGEAKDLLDNLLIFTNAPDPNGYKAHDRIPHLIQAMASVSIAESLHVMSNDLASLCDMLALSLARN